MSRNMSGFVLYSSYCQKIPRAESNRYKMSENKRKQSLLEFVTLFCPINCLLRKTSYNRTSFQFNFIYIAPHHNRRYLRALFIQSRSRPDSLSGLCCIYFFKSLIKKCRKIKDAQNDTCIIYLNYIYSWSLPTDQLICFSVITCLS